MRTLHKLFNEWTTPAQAVGYRVGENVVAPRNIRQTPDGYEYNLRDIVCAEGAVFTAAMCDEALRTGVVHVLVDSWPENDGEDPDADVPEYLGGFLS